MFKSLFRYPKLIRSQCNHTKSILNILQTGQLGQNVFVQGWIKSIRKQKTTTFLDLNDGSTTRNLQIVMPHKVDSDVTVGSSISTSGILKQTPKGQPEVSVENVTVIGECDLNQGYPFAPKKDYEAEYLREHLHFRLRTNKFASVLRLRHAATMAIFNYLDGMGYFNVNTPILTSNDCEGTGETFQVIPENERLLKTMAKANQSPDRVYFNAKAFLTVSGQLHLEAAAHALNKVYTFGPTFRAENSRSRFHLSEFYMLELEQAFLNNLDDLLTLVEDFVKNITTTILEKHKDDVDVCNSNEANFSWINQSFVRITHKEALDILQSKLHKPITNGVSKEYEIALTEYFGHRPVFVVNWPKEEKPFYMKQLDNDYVAAFDLLAPNVGEIVGGSLREDDYDKLKSRIPPTLTQLDWYLDLRRFGRVPTGGFGLGFERYLQFILGIDNIKDTIPFPRWPHNCRL